MVARGRGRTVTWGDRTWEGSAKQPPRGKLEADRGQGQSRPWKATQGLITSGWHAAIVGGVDRRPGSGELVGRQGRDLCSGGGSLAEQKTILTGDHHGLIWATGEKHGSGWSWRRGRESLCGCEGAPRSPQERTLSLSSQSRPACRRRGPGSSATPDPLRLFL